MKNRGMDNSSQNYIELNDSKNYPNNKNVNIIDNNSFSNNDKKSGKLRSRKLPRYFIK